MKRKTLTEPTDFPTGAVVKTESGMWYINGRFRHLVKNPRIAKTWKFNLVITASESSLVKLIKAKPLGFRDGSLVGDISDGKVYLIAGKVRRLITKPESYQMLGRKRRDALWVAHDEINLHPEGEVL